jgi:hypothetical protein
MNMITHRVSPQAARYTPMGGREKCARCRFYIAPKWCGHVTGPVSPMGWCKYFSQEMRAQFGGSTVFGGGSSLALDLIGNPGVLPTGITVTRPSTATYADNTGTIRTAAVNASRWNYASGSLRGLLIEEARTNMLLNSGDVSVGASWVKTSFSGPVAPVVTANQATAPDGTVTAASIAYPAVSAGGGCIVYQTFVATANPYAVSVWLRGAVGGEQVYLMATPNDGATYYRATAVLTTAWQRIAVATPALTATSWFVMIGIDLRDVGQSAKPAQTVYAWGAQAERGAFATSYMPTVLATVTRAQDTCTIPTTGGWYNATNWSLLAEFQDVPGATAFFGLSDATFANSCYLGSDASPALSVVYAPSGGGTASGPVVSRTAVNKAAFSFTTTRLALAVNGGAVNAAVQATTPLSTATRLSLGNDPWSLSTAFSGHIRQVRAWPRTLSDVELQQVTT